jgi:hypothetical protein
MRERLSQLPITKIKNEIKFLPLKYYKDVNFNDHNYERHTNDTVNIEYFIKAKNNGPEKILNVNTNDLQININNEKIIDNYIQTKDKQILLLSQHISFMQETNDLNISIYQKKIKEQEDIINNLINQLKTNTLIFPD